MGTGKKPGLLCVCQICICGRHRCVHHPKIENKPKGACVFTEYKDTYRQFPTYEPVRPIKPDAATKLSTDPFNSDTSYAHAYTTHEVKPPARREPAKYLKPTGKVDGTSSYQHDYTGKAGEIMPSARPPYRPSTSDRPFSDTTVHRETYRPFELEVRHGIRPPPAIKLPTGKFKHQTTFQEDFRGHKGLAREAIRIPEPALAVMPGKFANETTTRRDYTAKESSKEKSARPAQNLIKHAGPFNYKTTCQTTYMWPDGTPASSCKPPEMTHLSEDPINSETTHNITYRPWDVPKRKGWKPKNGWSEPSEPFDHKTTFQHDYYGKTIEPAKSAKPDYRKVHPGDFDGLTTHMKEFKPWDPSKRENFRPAEGYKGPKTKFDSQTTFQADFKPARARRPSLCIPKEGGFNFNGDQNFRTMYKDTYLGERPPLCPAKSLDVRLGSPSKTGHTYKGDINGHQYFSYAKNKENQEVVAIQPSPVAVANPAVEVVG